jgi:hypothetical protein
MKRQERAINIAGCHLIDIMIRMRDVVSSMAPFFNLSDGQEIVSLSRDRNA